MLQTMLHRPAPLSVAGVYKTLRQIALEKGAGSAARRQQAILSMLRSCRWECIVSLRQGLSLCMLCSCSKDGLSTWGAACLQL